ncbi:MAG: SixA phosphatase family protein [Pseudobdellovibrionaceae bacterium]
MKLILFRHGLAVDRDAALSEKMEDFRRPLVAKGRERTEKMAKRLEGFDLDIDLLITSPLVRAMQTAEIVFPMTKSKDIYECAELVPSAPPQAFAQWLRTHSNNLTCVMAVGHEPQLSVFASWALSGLTTSFINLKKSGMICLEFESLSDVTARSAELLWVLSPKLLAKG